LKKFVIISLILALFSSCAVQKHKSDDKVFNKRKYRKGYHFYGFRTSLKKKTNVEPSAPRVKIKRENVELAYKIENSVSIMELPTARSIAEQLEPLETVDYEPQVELQTSASEVENTPAKIAEATPVVIPSPERIEESLSEVEEVVEDNAVVSSVSEYGSSLGLNSIGTSLVSNLGLKPKGKTPWLALLIPSFIFVSGSIMLFAHAKRRKKQTEIDYEAIKANLSGAELAAVTMAQKKEARQVTKKTVAMHVAIYSVVIALWLYLLY
tara:strand:+ start:1915 stop:2715 length:801 start_codon:yes stop_codon:yes gene_type:complete